MLLRNWNGVFSQQHLFDEYKKKSEAFLKQGIITKEALANARIERYVIGLYLTLICSIHT